MLDTEFVLSNATTHVCHNKKKTNISFSVAFLISANDVFMIYTKEFLNFRSSTLIRSHLNEATNDNEKLFDSPYTFTPFPFASQQGDTMFANASHSRNVR